METGHYSSSISPRAARLRLANLWLSQVTRNLADNCLRMFVFLLVAGAAEGAQEAAWHQITPFFILPFIIFAPINGAIGNSLPKGRVLVGANAYCLIITIGLALMLGGTSSSWAWCIGLGLSMAGSALYSATRYAMLPAVSDDTGIPLNRVTGWIDTGAFLGVIGGLLLGIKVQGLMGPMGIPLSVLLVMALNLISLLLALPASFPADVIRPEPPGEAVRGFWRDTGRIWREPEARNSLLGLALFMALMMAGAGALLAYTDAVKQPELLVDLMMLVGMGVAAGALLASLQGHPYRALGLISLGGIGMVLTLLGTILFAGFAWPAFLLGLMGGLANVPLRSTYQGSVPADARGNALAVSNMVNYVSIIVFSLAFLGMVKWGWLNPTGQLAAVALLTALGVGICLKYLYRPTIEQILELLIMPIYRIKAYGPGKGNLPERGPLLIIGNHAAWLDPLWMAKVIPRKLTAMMTSEFYDIPGLHFLMRHVVHAIRVEASGFRRTVPELDEAIAVLDRGGCVVLFPEGWVRRKPDRLLRKFGQGIWLILKQRPQVPVVACWIEGSWGSYTSHRDGPPLKNKKIDFWRHIDISVQDPVVLSEAELAEHRTTRSLLMRRVLEAREHLGLEVPEPGNEEDKQEMEEDD